MIRNQPLLWVLSIGFELMEVSHFTLRANFIHAHFQARTEDRFLCSLKVVFVSGVFSWLFATCCRILMNVGGTVSSLIYSSATGSVCILVALIPPDLVKIFSTTITWFPSLLVFSCQLILITLDVFLYFLRKGGYVTMFVFCFTGIWAGMRTVRYFDGRTYEWVGISQQPNIMGKVRNFASFLYES